MLDVPRMGDPTMTEPLPSHATMYVAHAVANHLLIELALSLSAMLAVTHPDERNVRGAEMLDQTLNRFSIFMDCKPARIADTLDDIGPYDADMAESVAAEVVGDGIKLIRDKLL